MVSSHPHPVMPSCDHLALVVSVLKEADSVSQPADRVRTLWKRNDKDHDPDPVHIPKRHNMVSRRSSPAGSASFGCNMGVYVCS